MADERGKKHLKGLEETEPSDHTVPSKSSSVLIRMEKLIIHKALTRVPNGVFPLE